MLNGKYQSFYPDETLKSEGSFSNNQRTGIWSIYDKKGNLILKRDYQNNFTFTQLYPDLPRMRR
jgi:antitoxin component YwqK of YwqJK toxin-antitoxin module